MDSYKKKHPELKHKDVMRALGAEWNSLNAKEKAPYEKRAQDDKAEYEAKKQQYEASKGGDGKNVKRKANATGDESEVSKKQKND